MVHFLLLRAGLLPPALRATPLINAGGEITPPASCGGTPLINAGGKGCGT